MDRLRSWHRWKAVDPLARSGLLFCSLLALLGVAWVAGWVLVAVPAALSLVGVAAGAVGVDSRMPGDWRRVDWR